MALATGTTSTDPGTGRSSSGLEPPPEAIQPPPALSPPARIAWAWRAYYDDIIDPALAAFFDLIREFPDRADAHYGAGRCLLARGELEAAAAQFSSAAGLDAHDPESRFYLGVIAYQQEDFRKAIALWSQADPLLQARPVGPMHRDLAWLMARAWLELGDVAQGQHWFERAFAQGGEGGHGELYPPGLALERTSSGRLPGGRFLPIAGRAPISLGAGIVFASGGVLWELPGDSRLREQLTDPPAGWRDSHPAPEPGGSRLAFIATDPEGKCWLFLQGADGTRRRLVAFPVAPVRPAWSIDRHVVAFVAGTGENPQPRVHLLQLSTGDVQVTRWPLEASSDPTFGPHDELVMSAQRNGRLELGRTELGQGFGEYLPTQAPRRDTPPANGKGPMSGTALPGSAAAEILASRAAVGASSRARGGPGGAGSMSSVPFSDSGRDTAGSSAGGGSTGSGSTGSDSTGGGLTGGGSTGSGSTGGDSAGSGFAGGGSTGGGLTGSGSVGDGSSRAVDSPAGGRGRGASGKTGARKASAHPLWVPDPWTAPELEQASSDEDPVPETMDIVGNGLSGKPAARAASQDEAPVRIVKTPPMDRRPPVSPDSGRTAGQASDRSTDLERKPAGEGDIRQPSVEPDRDGGALVYTRQVYGRKRIWLREPVRGLETVISPDGQDCSYPGFSPDGRAILFVCIEGSIYRPFLFDRESSRITALYSEALSAGAPAWLTRETVAR